MRFRQQLAFGIGAQIAIVILVAATAVATLAGATRVSIDETRHMFREVVAVDRVHIVSEELVSAVRGYLLTGKQDYLERAGSHRELLDAALASVKTLAADDPNIGAVERAVTAYERAIDEATFDRGRMTSLASLEQLYEQRVAPERIQLRAALMKLKDDKHEKLIALTEHEQTITSLATIVIIAGAAFAIALSLVIGVRMGRRVDAKYRSEEAAKAEASEAARARKELLDIVSHDLRSPLSTIMLGLDAARDAGETAHFGAIENAARRMQRLVDDLLDAARAEVHGLDLVLADTDSDEILRLTAEMFAKRAERAGIQLRVEHGTHAVLVADQDRVLQILANLVGNAFTVTPRGGEIVLAAQSCDGGVRFTVHDSGPGIPQGQATELFDAYRQGVHRSRRGSLGLGLYISSTLARAHGGSIGVDSASKTGSTFWVELPFRPASSALA